MFSSAISQLWGPMLVAHLTLVPAPARAGFFRNPAPQGWLYPGMSISYVPRKHGVAPINSLLFGWRRWMTEGGEQAVRAAPDPMSLGQQQRLPSLRDDRLCSAPGLDTVLHSGSPSPVQRDGGGLIGATPKIDVHCRSVVGTSGLSSCTEPRAIP
jgi:hypothetical protein